MFQDFIYAYMYVFGYLFIYLKSKGQYQQYAGKTCMSHKGKKEGAQQHVRIYEIILSMF